jgi:hypothetical protein
MIFFNNTKARNQLLKNGFVYTLRRPRTTGETIAVWGTKDCNETLCKVNVEKIAITGSRQDTECLVPYLSGSGFKTIQEWVRFAGTDAKIIYKVTRIEI